jgi:hypothetical protein
MEIVIKIPKEDYNEILKMRPSYPSGVFCWIKAIQNGIPLPKGHGRLIDETQIHKCGWDYIKHHAKTDAPTIIEGSESE